MSNDETEAAAGAVEGSLPEEIAVRFVEACKRGLPGDLSPQSRQALFNAEVVASLERPKSPVVELLDKWRDEQEGPTDGD